MNKDTYLREDNYKHLSYTPVAFWRLGFHEGRRILGGRSQT